MRQAREASAQIHRGEVWLTMLDPTLGTEIQKTRPCVVLSPPEVNARLRIVIAAPMTTGSRPAPTRIPINFEGRSGLILLEQIRTLDKRRLGMLDARTLSATLVRLREMFED